MELDTGLTATSCMYELMREAREDEQLISILEENMIGNIYFCRFIGCKAVKGFTGDASNKSGFCVQGTPELSPPRTREYDVVLLGELETDQTYMD